MIIMISTFVATLLVLVAPQHGIQSSWQHNEPFPASSIRRGTVQQMATNAAEPEYWVDGKDDVAIIEGEGSKSIKFTIRGNPKVLVRHRSARGFVYNPSRSSQDKFRDCLLELLPQEHHPTIIDSGDSDDDKPIVMFPEHEFLKLSVTFRMKRPNNHFIGNKPGPGRLKPNAPRKYYNNRGDVDNFCKFVMDSLNQVLYADDRQVVCLDAVKVLDSFGYCKGATDVEISVLNDEDDNVL